MKWSIIGLFSLGLIAALSAVVLVVSFLEGNPSERRILESPASAAVARDVQILVASRDLGLRSVVAAEDVLVRTVSSTVAPQSSFEDPVQVVGKVLIAPLKEGQAFTKDFFASQGSGLHLASALVEGKRAVSVVLNDDMGMENLLYPGCVVDVIASMTMKDEPELGEQPVSMTLLEGVLVLAIDDNTVVAADRGEAAADQRSRYSRSTVTLLLTPNEAEKLKLAMDQGSVSLILRNPMDDDSYATDGTRLAELAPILAQVEAMKRAEIAKKRAQEEEEQRMALERARYDIERARDEFELAKTKFEQDLFQARQAAELNTVPHWETVILRGGEAEKKTFARSKNSD